MDKIKQDLVILDEPKVIKKFGGYEYKFWSLPVSSYIKLSKVVGNILDIIQFDENGDPIGLDATKVMLQAESFLELISECLRCEVNKLKQQPGEFLIWALSVIITEVIDINFMKQEAEKIKKALSPLFSKESPKSPEIKVGA